MEVYNIIILVCFFFFLKRKLCTIQTIAITIQNEKKKKGKNVSVNSSSDKHITFHSSSSLLVWYFFFQFVVFSSMSCYWQLCIYIRLISSFTFFFSPLFQKQLIILVTGINRRKVREMSLNWVLQRRNIKDIIIFFSYFFGKKRKKQQEQETGFFHLYKRKLPT